MCVDYTNLNKACPKDPFPLPRIDQIVDWTAGCETLCFLDAYSGYHQIPLKIGDQEATAFITPFGSYCYVTMPFGLKNAGATYQRCMIKCFGDLIGRIVQAYVDDIVVKSTRTDDLVTDLEAVFQRLRENGVKLNPEKCVFGVPKGMLLGYSVSQRGIEANHEKIEAIAKMGPIKNLKGVQKLTGCLAALSRFISRLGEKGLPLYRLLKKSDNFVWTPEAQEALDHLKAKLSNAPILTSPTEKEPLLLYIAATSQVVSTALVVEREEPGKVLKVQRPVYYVSEVLSDCKTRWPRIQKVLYALIITRRKLRHYFDAHPVTVVSTFPLAEILGNPEVAVKISKWALELMDQGIEYTHPSAVKSHTLVDFIAEWTETQLPVTPNETDYWRLFFDGSLTKRGAGSGWLLISPRGVRMQYVIRLNFPASHNVAEYEALLNGMKAAAEMGVRRLEAFGDSQLVVDQVMNESTCTNPKMAAYCAEVRRLEEKFDGFQAKHVPRRDNEAADSLAKMGSNREPTPAGIFACDLDKPSIDDSGPTEPAVQEEEPPPTKANEALVVERGSDSGAPADPCHNTTEDSAADPDWRQPFLNYLLRQQLPSDHTEARRLARRAKAFVVVGDELYKKGHSGVLQRCIPLGEGRQLLQDIHGGTCGHHAAPRSLVGSAFRHGFYWPTAVADAQQMVRTCEGCQHYARKTHLPAQALQTIPITWPFAVWGLDLVGPFKKAPGGFTHLLVAVDKFSKWIEAKPIAKIESAQAVKFFTDIVHRR